MEANFCSVKALRNCFIVIFIVIADFCYRISLEFDRKDFGQLPNTIIVRATLIFALTGENTKFILDEIHLVSTRNVVVKKKNPTTRFGLPAIHVDFFISICFFFFSSPWFSDETMPEPISR